MSADIGKMFREISLHPSDRDYHRFVTTTKEGDIRDMRMTRLTFGVTSSPFLATQTLRKLADDYSSELPQVAQTVHTSFYVDDCLTGADNLEEAISLCEGINDLMSRGCMKLRKWRTSSAALRATIQDELLETESTLLITTPSSHHKALGVHWDTGRDTLHVATPQLDAGATPTKRQVLSDVACTFDVLGLFTPITITLKILLQKVWLLGLDWDDVLPSELVEIWRSWRQQLTCITTRTYMDTSKDVLNLQLHGYADASTAAYAGVVYIRVTYTDACISTNLVLAKSKVAPLKTLTVPKLELCAAVLVSKLLTTVAKELNIPIEHIYAWSNSTITLSWIKTQPVRLKTFVANRVIDNVPPLHWRHVPTNQNPADLGSRGVSAEQLVGSSIWWNGPDWLGKSPQRWPVKDLPPQYDKLPELKNSAATLRAELSVIEDYSLRQSNFDSLCSLFSWISRFINNSKMAPPDRTLYNYISTKEVEAAETKLILLNQVKFWSREISTLKTEASLERSSSLISLHPFLDPSGVLRVVGRLHKYQLAFKQQHPAILHKKSHLTEILVRTIHCKHHHAGPTLLMGQLSRKYHVVGARSLVRQISRSCVTCQRDMSA